MIRFFFYGCSLPIATRRRKMPRFVFVPHHTLISPPKQWFIQCLILSVTFGFDPFARFLFGLIVALFRR